MFPSSFFLVSRWSGKIELGRCHVGSKLSAARTDTWHDEGSWELQSNTNWRGSYVWSEIAQRWPICSGVRTCSFTTQVSSEAILDPTPLFYIREWKMKDWKLHFFQCVCVCCITVYAWWYLLHLALSQMGSYETEFIRLWHLLAIIVYWVCYLLMTKASLSLSDFDIQKNIIYVLPWCLVLVVGHTCLWFLYL